ncbi:protein rep [Pseudomonas sp. Pseusp97]|uniref:protein rep n=1 Tax=Pseudomonas sp. Pseusp97 TaxID=3243065 RepID=UPI0039A59955
MDDSAVSLRAESGQGTDGGAPLGNTAKSSPPSPQAKRADRYEGLGYARFVLSRHARQLKPNAMAGDVYRTVDCRYVRRDRTVGVHFSAVHQGAHYSNLATCGSVWACPVCCALIQQRRRVELAQLIEWAYANDYRPLMVTFTFPHTAFDTLEDLMAKQKQAFEFLRKGSPWDKFKKRYGYGGLVRSLELTHGENGWHPHTHEIWLIRDLSPIEEVAFVEFVRERWLKVCERVGLVTEDKRFAFMLHAVDVRFGVSQSDYLAKQDASRAWGADREVATSTSKSGRASGVHPHEFLIRRAKGDSARYLDYVHAMKGRAQLFWSHGLKARVGVEDVTDEVLADESLEPADLLGLLSADQWSLVRRRRKRAQLLDVAETGDWLQVLRFLKSIGWDAYA